MPARLRPCSRWAGSELGAEAFTQPPQRLGAQGLMVTFPIQPSKPMTNTPASSNSNQEASVRQIHMDQHKRVELFIGSAAMLGIVIAIIVEGLTGFGMVHLIGAGNGKIR